MIKSLPPTVHAGVVDAMAHTIQTVFLIAVPIAFVAFLLSWLLPEIELRKSIRTSDPGEAYGMPESSTSLQEVQQRSSASPPARTARSCTAPWPNGPACSSSPERAGCSTGWRIRPGCTLRAVASRLKVDPERIEPGFEALAAGGYIEKTDGSDGCDLRLTVKGDDAIERLGAARRAGMTELLEGWDPEGHPEVVEMVRRLAHELLADDEKLLADARSAAAPV